jgi:DNA primase
MKYLKKDKNLSKVDDVSKYINQVIKELNKANDDVLIDLTVNKLVSDFNIDKNVLMNKIIKVDTPVVTKVELPPKKKISKNAKLASLLLYYMINDIKYIKLYQQELSYIPDKKYDDIANDILAFYLKYNYINIADFITNEIQSDYYEDVLSIIDTYYNCELNDNEYVGIINKIKIWINEEKIEELKNKLHNISDINEKLLITDEIAKLKKKEV